VRYSNNFRGKLGAWLYEVESREGNYFLTQPEVDAIAEHLRLEQPDWSDNEFQDRDREAGDFFDFDSTVAERSWATAGTNAFHGVSSSSAAHRRNPPSSPTLSPLCLKTSVHFQPRAASAATLMSTSHERPVPTSSRTLKFEPTKQVRTETNTAGAHVACAVSKKRKRLQDGLLDWLKSGNSPRGYNPYLGLKNFETAAETKTPKRPRTRSGKDDRGTAGGDSSGSGRRKKAKARQKRAQRKSRKGKWDAAYKAMLALPLTSGLSRDEVYRASKVDDQTSMGFPKDKTAMNRFLATYGWVFKRNVLAKTNKQ
jgi:hypothetical protein